MHLSSSTKIWLVVVLLSLVAHASSLGVLGSKAFHQATTAPDKVKVRIVEKKVEAPPPPPPAPPPPPPPKPKERLKPKPKAAAKSERAKPQETPPIKPVAPIQGLDKNSFDKNGKGIAAPIGNTLNTEDKGIRVQEAAPITQDMSADPQLIRDSVSQPAYTDVALDANFEGYVVVDVLVDKMGKVVQAELKKKVGYGMDQRILDVVNAARFVPRKGKVGEPLEGWSEIKFNFQLP